MGVGLGLGCGVRSVLRCRFRACDRLCSEHVHGALYTLRLRIERESDVQSTAAAKLQMQAQLAAIAKLRNIMAGPDGDSDGPRGMTFVWPLLPENSFFLCESVFVCCEHVVDIPCP